MALLSDLSQFPQFIFTVADGLPQCGALLLHSSQQPLKLIDALVFLLIGFFCTPQLLLLVTQMLSKPAAFSLDWSKSFVLNIAFMQII